MNSVADHYERLLAERYVWMSGPSFDGKVDEQRSLLQRFGIGNGSGAPALDLGCGPGFQAIALADLGFRVAAIDSSEKLLAELHRRKGNRPIDAIVGDIRELARFIAPETIAVAVCLGDTLTHLESKPQVWRLFADVHRALLPGGRFIVGFRDLSVELTGLDRFIPVRSDAERIMTCFLDYEEGGERVMVHDLVYERGAGGGWKLLKSRYPKLRLEPAGIVAEMKAQGFSISHFEAATGPVLIVAEKAP